MMNKDCVYYKDNKCTFDPRGVLCECVYPGLNTLLAELSDCGVPNPRSQDEGRQISKNRDMVFKKLDSYLSSIEADFVRSRINHFRSVTQLSKE